MREETDYRNARAPKTILKLFPCHNWSLNASQLQSFPYSLPDQFIWNLPAYRARIVGRPVPSGLPLGGLSRLVILPPLLLRFDAARITVLK